MKITTDKCLNTPQLNVSHDFKDSLILNNFLQNNKMMNTIILDGWMDG